MENQEVDNLRKLNKTLKEQNYHEFNFKKSDSREILSELATNIYKCTGRYENKQENCRYYLYTDETFFITYDNLYDLKQCISNYTHKFLGNSVTLVTISKNLTEIEILEKNLKNVEKEILEIKELLKKVVV